MPNLVPEFLAGLAGKNSSTCGLAHNKGIVMNRVTGTSIFPLLA